MAKKTQEERPSKEDLLSTVNELENKWKRALADYQNLEKRVAMERGQFIKLANVGLLDKFLGVLDDLERAAEHLNDEGLNMVVKQFHSVLQSEGVEQIEAKAAEFDPNLMDCVDMKPGEKNRVVEVVEKGYTLDETVIRPAKVHVGDGSSSNSNTDTNQE